MRSIFFSFIFLIGAHLLQAQPTAVDKNDLYTYERTYDLGNNHRITLGIFDEFKSLVYLDLKTLKLGALVPIQNNIFRDNNDSSKIFTFSRDKENNVSSLMIVENSKPIFAKRIFAHSRRAVSFKSDKKILKGDLYIPSAKAPHAAIVFAHGSGPATRSVAFFTTYFLQLGIAVLTFDKQGAGESGGDWQTASFGELANDVVAAVQLLKKEKNINPKQIGVLGNSQGGWIGSMAAARSKDIAFLLMRVGSGENVMETMLHENRGIALADGFNEKEIEEMITLDRSFMNTTLQGKSWEQGDSVIQSYNNAGWFKQVYPKPRIKSTGSEKNWAWLQKHLLYDSYDYLKKVKVPVLWMMAEKDWNVNSQKSYPRVDDALKKAGNKDFTVKIIPNSGHSSLLAKTGYYNEPFSWEYAAGFWDTMKDWLHKRKLTR